MNIYLIGYRCTGKTTIGQKLAHRIDWPFLDLDQELVREQGKSIRNIVAQHGWPGFRRAESQLIQTVSLTARSVIATGGGAVLDPDNVRRLRDSGRLIWLRAEIDTIRRRMQQDCLTNGQRPPLSSQGVLDEIEATLQEREPIYRQAMHTSIATDGMTVNLICDQIVNYLKRLPGFNLPS